MKMTYGSFMSDPTIYKLSNTGVFSLVGPVASSKFVNYGLGDSGDTDTEYMEWYHDGTNSVINAGESTGAGNATPLLIQVDNTTAINISATRSIITSFEDNTTGAYILRDETGLAQYLNIDTTNSSESISYGNATTNPNFTFLGTGTMTTSGGRVKQVSTKTNDYTILSSDYTTLLDCSSNTVTGTLPASPTTGEWHNVKCINNTFACTVARNGKTIDGDASDLTLSEDESVSLQYDGTGWQII
jgi:hypothetical protein